MAAGSRANAASAVLSVRIAAPSKNHQSNTLSSAAKHPVAPPSVMPATQNMQQTVPEPPTARVTPLRAQHVYVPAGLLTKLPSPVEPIDLELTPIDNLPVPHTLMLTIMVGAHGAVVDVVAPPEYAASQAYIDQIATRFKDARFFPGEINGTAVNTALQITAVTETLSPSPSR